MKFKEGQQIVCVKEGRYNGRIKKNKVYTVKGISTTGAVYIDGVTDKRGIPSDLFVPHLEKRPFKPGDAILCVDDTGFASQLKRGETYEVADCDHRSVSLVGVTLSDGSPGAFAVFRFVGVGVPSVPAVVAAPSTPDPVERPSHYTAGKVECIDAIESATAGLAGMEAVCTSQVIKYTWRWKLKNGVEDLKKARWYLDRLISLQS